MPHTIGLGNVDNTRDLDKPISNATQQALDSINALISNMTDDVGELHFIINISYNQDTNNIELEYRNGLVVSIDTPISKSLNNVTYDPITKELVLISNDGTENRLDIQDLYVRYLGSENSKITVSIDGDQVTGDQVIKATINPKSIVSEDIADQAIISRLIKAEAITNSKIKAQSISTDKYIDRSVTTEKIAKQGVTNTNLANESVDGRTLFRPKVDNMILATVTAGKDPIWTRLTSDMIMDKAIKSNHIDSNAVTHDKIDNNAVGTNNLDDLSVTTEKIANKAVTNEKLADRSVTSNILAEDLILDGNARIRTSPDATSDNNQIADTRWIRAFAKNDLVIDTSNINNKAVTADKLFSSPTKNRILAVLKANEDPEWSTINNDMMGDNSVSTNNIIDNSVTDVKITDNSIETRHLKKDIVQTKHITDAAITSEKIYTSHEANRVLAALKENAHPTYSQVTESMMAPNSVGTMQIKNGSISPVKLESSNESQQVMTVGLRGSSPTWSKITAQMLNDRIVDGNKLFTSDKNDVVLAVDIKGNNPTWVKINSNMIMDKAITIDKLNPDIITNEHLQTDSVDSRVIKERSITTDHIAPDAIKLNLIESSDTPARVLAVHGLPYSTPMWSQITTDMIKDDAITKEKIFKSESPYRVLGTTQGGNAPEYVMITDKFIVDGSIISQKLERDLILYGSPTVQIRPPENARDLNSSGHLIPDCQWVVDRIIESKYNSISPEKILEIANRNFNGTPVDMDNIIIKYSNDEEELEATP